MSVSAEHEDAAENPDAKPTLRELLDAGKLVIDEARATLAELDTAMNTAVNVIPPFALDEPAPDDE